MPVSLCGSWDMVSNVNFEGYMIALGISLYTRKIALKIKHRKVIEQVGDRYVVKTLSTFRNYTFSFRVNEEFQECTDVNKAVYTLNSPQSQWNIRQEEEPGAATCASKPD
uniref:Retinol binding protein 7a, cellular n=1 Tax=Cyprinus carpio TaxID=7962 RepID=A0A8C2E4Z9_CYPCA